MGGFARRYSSPQNLSVITQIEGVITIDNPQPGPITELGTGMACCVGEFADCGDSLKSDGAGGFTTNYTPIQVFGVADGQAKFGAFDPTLGDFGITGGNGWVDAFSSKQWAALVIVAINIASAKATRLVRALPTNTSPTNPTPIVPMQAASVGASTQFQDGSRNRVRVAGAQQFTGTNAYGSGTDGALTTAASAATQTFTAASLAALISAKSVTIGDILVMGVVEAPPTTVTGYIGTAATGTLTLSTASGVVGGTIGGTLVTVTALGGDSATATALAAAINANATTNLVVSANAVGAVVTLTSLLGGTLGNSTTLVASGTGVTASGSGTLTGGANSTTLTITSANYATVLNGQVLSGSGITNGTTVVSGSGGTRTVSISQSAGSTTTTINGWDTYGAPGTMGAYTGTFRVNAIASGTSLTIEQLDGTSWAIQTAAALPWRLHNAATADTAAQGQALNPGALYSATKGYTVPARPMDATITMGTVMDLTTPAGASTASSWNPLSGLAMLVQGASDLVYTAVLQGSNAAYSSAIAAEYVNALASTLAATAPADLINIIWCARTDTDSTNTIKQALTANVSQASAIARGRTTVISPALTCVTTLAAISTAAPGVGANRSERGDYSWPGTQIFVPQAVNTPIATAVAGLNTTDGNLDVRMDAFLASILSVLAANRNPGQTEPPAAGTGGVLSVLNGFQRNAPTLTENDYITLRANGVAALYIASDTGPEIMSGVTSSLVSGQTTIMRRRMADMIEDDLSAGLKPYAKLPATQALIDAEEGAVVAYLDGLLSPNDPTNQQIAGYSVDANQASVSTAAAFAQGVVVIQVAVQLIPTQDFIVLNANIGTNVVLTLSVGNGAVSAQVA